MQERFNHLAQTLTHIIASSWFFGILTGLIPTYTAFYIIYPQIFQEMEPYWATILAIIALQLVSINLQTQVRDTKAMQLKLDDLIKHLSPDKEVQGAEEKSEEEIDQMKESHRA